MPFLSEHHIVPGAIQHPGLCVVQELSVEFREGLPRGEHGAVNGTLFAWKKQTHDLPADYFDKWDSSIYLLGHMLTPNGRFYIPDMNARTVATVDFMSGNVQIYKSQYQSDCYPAQAQAPGFNLLEVPGKSPTYAPPPEWLDQDSVIWGRLYPI